MLPNSLAVEDKLFEVELIREGILMLGEQSETGQIGFGPSLNDDQIWVKGTTVLVDVFDTNIFEVQGQHVQCNSFIGLLNDTPVGISLNYLSIVDLFEFGIPVVGTIWPLVARTVDEFVALEVFRQYELFWSCWDQSLCFFVDDVIELPARNPEKLSYRPEPHLQLCLLSGVFQLWKISIAIADLVQVELNPAANYNPPFIMEKHQDDLESIFIVIFGPPASGKTTLAHRIADACQQTLQLHKIQNPILLVSADCCEQYLRNNSVADLDALLSQPAGWKELSKFKLKRSIFNDQLWKRSRQFIKGRVSKWLQKWRIVIFQDDLLLKSQRKQMRQIVQFTEVKYLEIYRPCSLQQCLLNLQQRALHQNIDEHLPASQLKEAYQKFELDESPYSIPVESYSDLSFAFLQCVAKKVVTEHPEQRKKLPVSEENAAKDDVEHQIRCFISEIISKEEVREKYFKGKGKGEAASFLGKIKRLYKSKNKSLEEFISFLKEKTEKGL